MLDVESLIRTGESWMGFGGRVVFGYFLGPCLVLSLYAIIGLHLFAYFTVITPLLKSRLGTEMGLVWIVVGLSLVYNIVFNHLLAVILKPGGPQDTKLIEKMRA